MIYNRSNSARVIHDHIYFETGQIRKQFRGYKIYYYLAFGTQQLSKNLQTHDLIGFLFKQRSHDLVQTIRVLSFGDQNCEDLEKRLSLNL